MGVKIGRKEIIMRNKIRLFKLFEHCGDDSTSEVIFKSAALKFFCQLL